MSRTQPHAASLVLGNMTALTHTKTVTLVPVAERIDFKIPRLTLKSLNDMVPIYLHEIISSYIISRMLPSSSKSLLVVIRCNLKTHSQRAFSYIAPVLWNSLPKDKRSCKVLTPFFFHSCDRLLFFFVFLLFFPFFLAWFYRK